jgi:hypothetical protein
LCSTNPLFYVEDEKWLSSEYQPDLAGRKLGTPLKKTVEALLSRVCPSFLSSLLPPPSSLFSIFNLSSARLQPGDMGVRFVSWNGDCFSNPCLLAWTDIDQLSSTTGTGKIGKEERKRKGEGEEERGRKRKGEEGRGREQKGERVSRGER